MRKDHSRLREHAKALREAVRPGSIHLWEKVKDSWLDRKCSRCKRVRAYYEDPEGECPGEAR